MVCSSVAGLATTKSDRPVIAGRPAIQAILFDLDNTLIDRDAGFVRFCRELYHASSAMSQTHTEDEAVALMAQFDADGRRSRHDLFNDVMRQWPGVFQDLEQAMQVYLTSYPERLVLEPLTRALLEDLQDAGTPCGIVTNGGAIMQMNKIRETGLDGLVQAIVISEEMGVAKPDRRIFQRALGEIKANPLTTMFVGDDPDADMLGAKGLGMRTAWVRRSRQWPYAQQRPDYIVGDVSEIRDVILGSP